MLLVLVISVFFLSLIFGLGLFVIKILPILSRHHDNIFNAFWIGLALLIAFLQIWHFFFPINVFALVIISILSLIGWIANIRLFLSNQNNWIHWTYLLLILPLIIYLHHAIYSFPSYDHGLYHLQTVKWFNQYAIVPGLGNLQHRLAFNSANYLYAAFLNTSIFHGYSYYIADVLLMFVVTVQSILDVTRWITHPKTASVRHLYGFILLPIIIWQASHEPLAGYPADLTVFVLQLLIFGKLLDLWEIKEDGKKFRSILLQIVIFSAAGVAVKLSFAVFSFLSILIAYIIGYRRLGRGQFIWKNIIPGLSIISLFGIPWLLRNFFLSGYLLFPSTLISIPVKWRMPDYLASNIQNVISMWARTWSDQIEYTADLTWFATWLKRFDFDPRLAFFLAVMIIGTIFLLSMFKRFHRINLKKYTALLAIPFISILSWFFTAPTYRFSGAVIWLLFVVALLMLIEWTGVNISIHFAWKASILLLLFLFVLFPNNISRNLSFSRIITVLPEHELTQAQIPSEEMEIRTTNSGLLIYTPESIESCWDFPLPCTTPNDFLPTIQLRDPEDMGKGFFIPERN